MSRFFSPSLSELAPYVPGEQPQDKQYIKLNTNESPYPPSPRVSAAITQAQIDDLRLYSDPETLQLRQAAASAYGLSPEQVMVGNGSDENLAFALRAFCCGQTPLAFANITYGFYAVWAKLMNLPTRVIPLRADFTLDPTDYYGLNCTIVIANPGAPTGIALPTSAIEGILQQNPNNVIIVDEAYIDFGGESCIPLLCRYENLMVVQTFSKSRSLAGARLGLSFGSKALIDDVNRVRNSFNPYNVNRLSLLAGKAALEDTAYFAACLEKTIETRHWAAQQLKALGFELTESVANFLFAGTPRMPGNHLYEQLRRRGILVRRWNSPLIENHLRITIGTRPQMETLVRCLTEILED